MKEPLGTTVKAVEGDGLSAPQTMEEGTPPPGDVRPAA